MFIYVLVPNSSMCLFTFAAISYMYIFKKVYNMPSTWCHTLWFCVCIYICTVLQWGEGEADAYLLVAVSTLKYSVFLRKLMHKIWANDLHHMNRHLFFTLMSNIRSYAVHSNGLHVHRPFFVPTLPKTYLTFSSLEDSMYIFIYICFCYWMLLLRFLIGGVISALSPRRIRVLCAVFKLAVFYC